MTEPLYTPDNCRPAYQLRWSLALFVTSPLPASEDWIVPLKQSVESDNVRILDVKQTSIRTWHFLLSTTPTIAPPTIVKSVKGRLQHLLQKTHPKVFQRNFSLISIGDASRTAVENYVSEQLEHHPAADRRMQEMLSQYQLSFPSVDLSKPRYSSHGQYLYNLHLVFVHESRMRESREAELRTTREMIVKTASKKEHVLSNVAILSDHVHLTVGCPVDHSPQIVALGYLNNLAYAHGMQRRYKFGYYAGTFGEYDMNAIRQVS
jgi:REP element-mobilizing transposase RayT